MVKENILRKGVDFFTANELNEKLNNKLDGFEAKKKEKAKKQTQKNKEENVERKEKTKEKRKNIKETFAGFSLKNYFRSDNVEDDGYWYFTNKEKTEDYRTMPLKTEMLADANKVAYSKKMTGQDLLKRNLKASPLYILDEENVIKVVSIQRVYDYNEENNNNVAYIMLETKYEYFVIEYNITHTF